MLQGKSAVVFRRGRFDWLRGREGIRGGGRRGFPGRTDPLNLEPCGQENQPKRAQGTRRCDRCPE